MIYTTGTIAVSGNTLTGTGTNFTAAGSLIRVGCTVIAMTSPPQVFQITGITSSTVMTVSPAASPALAAGTKYSILLSDSLSVDGLAQDIAETFAMYQRNISGFADVMNGSGDVTITVDGKAVTVPGQKSLAKKGANSDITSLTGLKTALSIAQGGTGATTAAGIRTNAGLGSIAERDVGTSLGNIPPVVGKSNGRYVSAFPLTELAEANMDGGGTAAGYMIIGADVGSDGIRPVGMVGTITYSRGGTTSSNSPGRIDVLCQCSHRTSNLVARLMVQPGSRTLFTGFFTATYAGKKVYLVGLAQSGGPSVNGVYFDGILFNDNEANNIFKVVRVSDIADLAPYTERSAISYPVTSSSQVEVGTNPGDAMPVGAFGLGTDQGLRIPNFDYNMIDRSGFYAGPGATESTNAPANTSLGDLRYGAAIAAIRSSADGFIIGARSKEIQFRTKNSSAWSPYYRFYTDANTTKVSDGTLKVASPVARIASPDACIRPDIVENEFKWCGYGVANDEARGIEIIRDDMGVYRVTGAKSLASSGWRLQPPQDPDGSGELGIVKAEQKDDEIIIKLFRRKMVLADGEIVIQPGEPIDVPVNSWIDVRLDMPEATIPPDLHPENEGPLIQPE